MSRLSSNRATSALVVVRDLDTWSLEESVVVSSVHQSAATSGNSDQKTFVSSFSVCDAVLLSGSGLHSDSTDADPERLPDVHLLLLCSSSLLDDL